MNVRDLKEKLQNLPDDLPVVLLGEAWAVSSPRANEGIVGKKWIPDGKWTDEEDALVISSNPSHNKFKSNSYRLKEYK